MSAREKIEAKIREIMLIQLEISENADFDEDLKAIGINSINFIRLIVEIEQEFGFEFDDEALSVEEYHNMNGLVDYIESNI